jgi:hypothetical protein
MIARCDKHIERFHAVVKRTYKNQMYVDCPYCDRGYHFEDGQWMADRLLYVHSMADVYVLIVHEPSKDFYTLDRGYQPNSDVPISHMDLMAQKRGFVERESNHRQASLSCPTWAENKKNEDFTTYWTY